MQDQGINTTYHYYSCDNLRVPTIRRVTIILIFSLVTILLCCALFMAIKTRKVHIKGLNDAKYIAAIVYVSSLGSVAYIIISYTISGVSIHPPVITSSVMLTHAINLSLTFIPKVS